MAYENHKRKTIRNKVRKGKCKEENERQRRFQKFINTP
jgi:hypothetical protein